jgi:hypothetical protein
MRKQRVKEGEEAKVVVVRSSREGGMRREKENPTNAEPVRCSPSVA